MYIRLSQSLYLDLQSLNTEKLMLYCTHTDIISPQLLYILHKHDRQSRFI